MALSPTKKALCNKLVTDYYTLITPVKSAKSVMKQNMSELDSFIRGMTFSNPVDLQGAIDGFEVDSKASLPGSDNESIDELKDFISQCTYLQTQAPTSNVYGTKDGALDQIKDYASDLIPSFPEFGAGSLASAINDVLSGSLVPGSDSLSAILRKADQLLNCIDALCPGYSAPASDIANDLQSLYNDLNLIDSGPNTGTFDYTSFFDNAGLSSIQQGAINSVTNSIDSQKQGAISAVQNSVNKVKDLVKGGLF